MYKVKISACWLENGMTRQIPKSNFLWNDYEFHVNDDIQEADFWVVCYQKLSDKSETCRVAPENTLFFTWEPDSTYHYSKKFLNQFAKVVSCVNYINHKNVVKDQPGLSWFMGKGFDSGRNPVYHMNWDELYDTHPKKIKMMSVICSNKCYTKGHRDRIEFVKRLKEHFGDMLDIYGRGFNDFDDKWNTIAPYKYHISIENCSQPYYWSEKLSDVYLGEAFPFYYGCSNISSFFSQEAYRAIDIHNVDKSIEIIEMAINDNLAEKKIDAIRSAKNKVMTEENFFALIIKYIQNMDPSAPKKNVTIVGDLSFFDYKKFEIIIKRYLGMYWYKLINKFHL